MGCPLPKGTHLCGRNLVLNSKGALKAKLIWGQIWFQPLLSREAIASHFTSLKLSFSICKMET